MWAPRGCGLGGLLKGKSFAIVAPTGSGKTTFGMVASYTLQRGEMGKF
jgi:Reverse gyrase